MSKAFAKEQQLYPQLGVVSGSNPANIRPEYINELSQNLNKHGSSFVDAQIHSNIDSLLQIHRRKMLRRAANRKSAQLSRARKKAHLEELKVENSRLQRLVDVLDSQPELVFCVTSLGRITYVSERTINFIKINLSGDESDEDPTNIGQILNAESAKKVLEAISHLRKYSSTQSADGDANMVFSAKEVYFHDAFGHPLVGYLRCSKVYRRTTLQELQSVEGLDELNGSGSVAGGASVSSAPSIVAPPAKKTRGAKSTANKDGSSTPGTSGILSDLDLPVQRKGAIAEKINTSVPAINSSNSSLDDWNLSKFKLLTDCASSLTGDEALPSASPSFANMLSSSCSAKATSAAATPCTTETSFLHFNNGLEAISSSSTASLPVSQHYNNSQSNHNSYLAQQPPLPPQQQIAPQQQPQQQQTNQVDDSEDEYVCVIRTSDNCFAPHRMSNCDLLMFSSLLSTASIFAHDLQENGTKSHRRGSSPNGSSSSSRSKNSSSDAPPNSDSSKEASKNNCTSSETGSEDNNSAETDST